MLTLLLKRHLSICSPVVCTHTNTSLLTCTHTNAHADTHTPCAQRKGVKKRSGKEGEREKRSGLWRRRGRRRCGGGGEEREEKRKEGQVNDCRREEGGHFLKACEVTP